MSKRSVPRYCLHKPSGQARVRIDGKDHYLGLHGTPESHAKYAKLIALTAEVQPVRDALKRLNRLYRDEMAAEFLPRMLKRVRQAMIDENLARTTINGAVGRIRRMSRGLLARAWSPHRSSSGCKLFETFSGAVQTHGNQSL